MGCRLWCHIESDTTEVMQQQQQQQVPLKSSHEDKLNSDILVSDLDAASYLLPALNFSVSQFPDP